jgi:hypothetical protein
MIGPLMFFWEENWSTEIEIPSVALEAASNKIHIKSCVSY